MEHLAAPPLGWADPDEPLWARDRIAGRLALSGLAIESYWTFVVPEVFATPEEVYHWRSWGYLPDEVAPYAQVRPILDRVFTDYAGPQGVVVLQSRFLWQATVGE